MRVKLLGKSVKMRVALAAVGVVVSLRSALGMPRTEASAPYSPEVLPEGRRQPSGQRSPETVPLDVAVPLPAVAV